MRLGGGRRKRLCWPGAQREPRGRMEVPLQPMGRGEGQAEVMVNGPGWVSEGHDVLEGGAGAGGHRRILFLHPRHLHLRLRCANTMATSHRSPGAESHSPAVNGTGQLMNTDESLLEKCHVVVL